MPRPFSLADIVDTLNTGLNTALSPDTTDTQNSELINQTSNVVESTMVGSDGTPTVTTLSPPNVGTAVKGDFQWS